MLRIVNRIVARQSSLLKFSNGIKNVGHHRLFSTSGKFTSINAKFVATSVAGVGGYLLFKEYLRKEASCEAKAGDVKQAVKQHEVIRDDLPYYSDEELALHDNKYRIVNYPGVDTSHFDVIGNACEVQREKGIWISYGVGIYDITNLIDKHGTPEVTILLAAGMALDQFWDDEEMKKLHEKPYIYEMLEKCRIGNLIKS